MKRVSCLSSTFGESEDKQQINKERAKKKFIERVVTLTLVS
jgi:hypothetical protein